MSGEGESDDSTTIRRKILLSPTMPPQDSMDHDGSPLANLIGQVCLEHFTARLIQNLTSDSVSNGTLACGRRLVTSRNTPTSLRRNHRPVICPSSHADIVPFQQLAATRLKVYTRYVQVSYFDSHG